MIMLHIWAETVGGDTNELFYFTEDLDKAKRILKEDGYNEADIAGIYGLVPINKPTHTLPTVMSERD